MPGRMAGIYHADSISAIRRARRSSRYRAGRHPTPLPCPRPQPSHTEANVKIATDVDTYIQAAPAAAQPMLTEVRRIIREGVPDAVENIKYGMPSYAVDGQAFAHFAATKQHVAVYGVVHVDHDVPADLAPYLGHRSTLQFKLGEELPSAALEDAIRRKAGEG